VVDEFFASVLMGTGQFCTNPGLVIALAGQSTERFIQAVTDKFKQAASGTLISTGVQASLTAAIDTLSRAGAEILCGGQRVQGRCSVGNTLMRVTGQRFLLEPEAFQTEAFGNAALVVVADGVPQAELVLKALEGNLTGCIYSAHSAGYSMTRCQPVLQLVQRCSMAVPIRQLDTLDLLRWGYQPACCVSQN
jgi:NADP-dependent aldehyde dehydrogenase